MAYGRVYFAEHLLLGINMKLCKDCKYAKYTTVSTRCSYNPYYAISPVDGKVQTRLLKSAFTERAIYGTCRPKGINFEPITLKGRVKRYFDKYKLIIISLSVLLICISILALSMNSLLNSPITQQMLYCSI